MTWWAIEVRPAASEREAAAAWLAAATGILAVAAVRAGASSALGIDCDDQVIPIAEADEGWWAVAARRAP